MSSDSIEKNVSSKYDLVILNKVDPEGNFSLLHTKPLTVELFHQIPDSTIIFSESKRPNLFKYAITKDFEFAKLGQSRLIINTNNESISIQFAKETEKNEFIAKLSEIKKGKKLSTFDEIFLP